MDFNNPCLCCLVRESEKDLKAKNLWLGNEAYYDMIQECFKIKVFKKTQYLVLSPYNIKILYRPQILGDQRKAKLETPNIVLHV